MAAHEERAQALTHRAFAAAQSGRWDEVLRCYRERAAAFGEGEISAALAVRLSTIDREIDAHARAALAALGASLEEAAAARQRLGRLREQLLIGPGTGRLANRRG
jgi:hypothetical protein